MSTDSEFYKSSGENINKDLKLLGSVQAQLYTRANMFI